MTFEQSEAKILRSNTEVQNIAVAKKNCIIILINYYYINLYADNILTTLHDHDLFYFTICKAMLCKAMSGYKYGKMTPRSLSGMLLYLSFISGLWSFVVEV